MKKLFLIFALFASLYASDSTSVHADSVHADSVYADSLLSNFFSEPNMSLVEDVIQVAQNSCSARTICWDGYAISCYAYGAGCTWYVQAGQYVQCTGYVGGYWTTVYQRCF